MGSTRMRGAVRIAGWVLLILLCWPPLYYMAVFGLGSQSVQRIRPVELMIGGSPPFDLVNLILLTVAFSVAGFVSSVLAVGVSRLLNAPRPMAFLVVALSVALLALKIMFASMCERPDLLDPARHFAFWTPFAFTILGSWLGSRVSPIPRFSSPGGRHDATLLLEDSPNQHIEQTRRR